ncbi:XRE family transcriptional regulator [Mucilaginibacter sp. BJC16-A38]|uniref:XRE family transcriptional regulator n=1 Tax=Mucilaginibacter phenanthrenivorans TaxID=1234842 RepID=UPI00215727D5|nr:XRE family transcriptional regulator [Mucilaginibacter phenanthrenivorans]MCR8560304.1 XRE family transcriptional regulator [Mucilaginibacter phenanthrenivorans]
MISNQLNIITGSDPEQDTLKKLGNRVKTLRIKAGHQHYEKFAFQNNIGRILLRRCELGGNVKFSSLLRIINALGVTPAEFFSKGFD